MPGSVFQPLIHSLTTLSFVARDLVRLMLLAARSRRALAAENLFLRKQLALFQEREVPPHRATDATRWLMVFGSSAWARAYFEQQRAQGKPRNTVLRALAFKWIRILFRAGRTTS